MAETIQDLRSALFEQIAALRAARGTDRLQEELQIARATVDVAARITDTAKVEVDYARVLGAQPASAFVAVTNADAHLPAARPQATAAIGAAPPPAARGPLDVVDGITWPTLADAQKDMPAGYTARRVLRREDGRVAYVRVKVAA